MIQVSYMIEGAPFGAEVPLPLRAAEVVPAREEAPGAPVTRLTGLWPHRDVHAARRQVAAALATLPPETQVRCNFTGRAKTAAAWARELAAQPTVTSLFEARHAIVEDRVVARLFGLYQIGESDIVLIADAHADIAEVYRFLNGWAAFRLRDAREPQWDRPFPWGYWLVSFAEHDIGDDDFWVLLRERLATAHLRDAFDERMFAPPPRLVIEASDPGDPDTDYMVGAALALMTSTRQRATGERLGARLGSTPNAQDAAGFCDRLVAAIEGRETLPFFAYREQARGELDSGWRLACTDDAHLHDDQSLRIAPLSRAVGFSPGLVDYLALPPGWVVTFEDGAYWTNAPDDPHSHRDERPPEPRAEADVGPGGGRGVPPHADRP